MDALLTAVVANYSLEIDSYVMAYTTEVQTGMLFLRFLNLRLCNCEAARKLYLSLSRQLCLRQTSNK